MAVRFIRICCKLIQRQTYSCLSTKTGIWFCVGGLFLLAISTLQFSEMLIEFSIHKYTSACHGDCDNIRGNSFQKRLCLPSPIDLVYTWVNGTDPKLLLELRKLKLELAKELPNMTDTRKNGMQTEPEYSESYKGIFKMVDERDKTFLPFNAIVIFDLFKNVSWAQLRKENELLEGSYIFEYKGYKNVGIKMVKFDAKENYKQILNSTVTLHGKPKLFEKVFITSKTEKDLYELENTKIINSLPYYTTPHDIQASLAQMNIVNATVKMVNHTAFILLANYSRDRVHLIEHHNLIAIKDKKFKLLPTMLVWESMKLQNLEHHMLNEDISFSRFADNDELKYSLRSVDKYAPWVRNIYIVTNGQIPSWLNLDHPRVTIVTHEEIFINRSHLPTYSSPSIETHIHRIPGLSKKFIYMNDDVFFGDQVWPDDFYTHAKGQKVYLTWPVPNCNDGCPASWVNDKYCDKQCNVSECDWDGGDCLNTKGKVGWVISSGSSFHEKSHSIVGQYCNSGCANSWIGDRYCDVNCNVKDCGFDAGDCGIENFDQIFSIKVDSSVILANVPKGETTFYVNFTKFMQDGLITEGNYKENSVIRTAVFSKKYRILTVSLHKNFTDVLMFDIKGFRDANQTANIEYSLNISVDTTGRNPSTRVTRNPFSKKPEVITGLPSTQQKPFTVYGNSRKEKKSQYDRNYSPQKVPVKVINKNMNMSLLFEQNKKNFPESIWIRLNRTEQKFINGDITDLGFQRKKFDILEKYLGENTLQRESKEGDDNQVLFHKPQRHLTSIDYGNNFQQDLKSNSWLENLWKKQSKQFQLRTTHAEKRSHGMLQKYFIPVSQTSYPGPFPWEKLQVFMHDAVDRERFKTKQDYLSTSLPGRTLLDTFASSLLHVSRIYNRAFSYMARKVPAHMPHMLDIDVINEMQHEFWPYFDETSSHKIRSPNDMQFAFSYFYYLMGVPAALNVSQVFSELDTDKSGILSDGELRTLAARLFSLPLEKENFRSLQSVLGNCSKEIINQKLYKSANISLPEVTEEFVSLCPPIQAILKDQIKKKTKYRYEVVGDEDVAFKMLRSNISNLVYHLDWVRKYQRKFVCLNDNIDHEKNQAKNIRIVLKDFYESLFPQQSQFELPRTHRNKFLTIDQLNTWKNMVKRRANTKMFILYFVLLTLVILIFRRKLQRLIRESITFVARKLRKFEITNKKNNDIVRI